ncbi:MAG: LOG family protein [Acidobacteria bacterium]|nr:MAG: LOG family protein [Acidobacteriota bacterium]
MKTVTIFGSSIPGEGTEIYQEAQQLGRRLAEAGFAICNGGYAGLMEASARGARDAGGHTIGVTCDVWTAKANRWIAEEVRTATFMERLLTLIERGDSYVVLPGGTGTLAELAVVWEMMNKSVLSRSVGGRKLLLVMVPYWRPVIECLGQETKLALQSNKIKMPALEIVTMVHTVDEAVARVIKEV